MTAIRIPMLLDVGVTGQACPNQPQCPWQTDTVRTFVILEEVYQGRTRGFQGLLRLTL